MTTTDISWHVKKQLISFVWYLYAQLKKHWMMTIWCSLFVVPVYAGDPAAFTAPSAVDIIKNLNEQIPNLMRLVTAVAYVIGIYFIFIGIIGLKHFGESRTMMSQEHSLKGPLLFLFLGASLIYLPTAVQTGLSTFWSDPCPYCYEKVGAADQWTDFYNLCYRIIQLIGVISFIRGLVILSHLSGHGGQQGQFGKGITHIIAGILCINIYQFVQLILTTLGVQLN